MYRELSHSKFRIKSDSLTGRQGFTIVELLIVVVVIGILAAITIVSYSGIVSRANDVSARSAAGEGYGAVMVYAATNADSFPATLSLVNVNNTDSTTFAYSVDNSTNPKTFCVSATVNAITYYQNSTSANVPTLGTCSITVPNITTLAGSGAAGSTDATGTSASFNTPQGIAWYGGNLYVADRNSNKIRKVTAAGVTTTFAGSGTAGYVNATGTAAQLSSPSGIAFDSSGNMFVADTYNHSIRKITSGGVVTLFAGNQSLGYGFADGTGSAARFSFPFSIAVDSSNNLYVADTYNYRIRKITPAGVVTTFAGSSVAGSADGTGTAAQFNLPYGVAVDASNNVFVSDTSNSLIRKITSAGVVTTVAGSTSGYTDGTGTAAQFSEPQGLVFDASGNLFISDTTNNRIRKMTPAGVVSTVAGSTGGYADGAGTGSQFSSPRGITYDSASNTFYIIDTANNRIRKLQ